MTKAKELFKDIYKLNKSGSNVPNILTAISKKYNINPYKMKKVYYPNEKNIGNDDIKVSKASYVTLNDGDEQKYYEVINIISKDKIIIKDIETNEQFEVSENEISPVIMENKIMKKNINEATYNLSIDGIETEDAGKLSQMLDIASQLDDNVVDDELQYGIAIPPSDEVAEKMYSTEVTDEYEDNNEDEYTIDDLEAVAYDNVGDDYEDNIKETKVFESVEDEVITDIDDDVLETLYDNILNKEGEDYFTTNPTEKQVEKVVKELGEDIDEFDGRKASKYAKALIQKYENEIAEMNDDEVEVDNQVDENTEDEIIAYDDYDFDNNDNMIIEDDDFETYAKCEWCNEEFPISELKKEKDLGNLCDTCIKAIESREGPLSFEEIIEENNNLDEDMLLNKKFADPSYFAGNDIITNKEKKEQAINVVKNKFNEVEASGSILTDEVKDNIIEDVASNFNMETDELRRLLGNASIEDKLVESVSKNTKIITEDQLDLLNKYESGDLDEDETIKLFQELVDSGVVWNLDTEYVKKAQQLIDDGKVVDDSEDEGEIITEAPESIDMKEYLIGLIDDGIVDADKMATDILNYMSEDEVEEFYNFYFDDDVEEIKTTGNRDVTNYIIDMIDNGSISAEEIANELIQEMSSDEAEEFARLNGYDESEDNELNESVDASNFLTKDELIDKINNDILPPEYEAQPIGQGEGYKIDLGIWNENFDENIVVYIPEYGYDNDGIPKEDDIYSFKDFIDICKGDREKALQLLEDVDWQSPETLYDEYDWDDELNESFRLSEGWKDNLKKAAGVAAVAGGLIGANPAHGMAHNHYDDIGSSENSIEQVSDFKAPKLKEIRKDGTYVDEYGNEFTKYQWELLSRGKDPFDDNDQISESVESEINKVLKNAGIKNVKTTKFVKPSVKLHKEEKIKLPKSLGKTVNEAKEVKYPKAFNRGQIITDKTLFANKNNERLKKQTAKDTYKQVQCINDIGKDATEGFMEPLTNFEQINETIYDVNKVNKIVETAEKMYKKRKSNDWGILDRRYLEKLILEGVSYTSASRMLQKAKTSK